MNKTELAEVELPEVLFPAGAQEEYGNHNNKGPAYGYKVFEQFEDLCEEKGYTNKTFEYLFNTFSGTPFEVHQAYVGLLLGNDNNQYEQILEEAMKTKIDNNIDQIKQAEKNEIDNPYLEKFEFTEQFGSWKGLNFTEKLKLFSSIPKLENEQGQRNLISLKGTDLQNSKLNEILNENNNNNKTELLKELFGDKYNDIQELSKFSENLKGIIINENNKSVEVSKDNINNFNLLEGEIAEPLKNLLDKLNKKVTIIITGMGGQENEKVPLLKKLVLHKNVAKVIVTNGKYISNLVNENTICLTNGWGNVEELANELSLQKGKIFKNYDAGLRHLNTQAA